MMKPGLFIVLCSMIFISACGKETTDQSVLASDDSQQSISNVVRGSSGHPRLLSSQADIANIKNSIESSATFKASLERAKARVDEYFASSPDVPFPADAGGGYTHEKHKLNAKMLNESGALYQVTGDEKYATYAKNLFLRYADLYPTLGLHPKHKHQVPGKLFWQSLNEAWWLVYSVQGYDSIYVSLTAEERNKIEINLLRNMAEYLSDGQPQTFDKIHNHGTWAVAAVGMTGYVLDDETYVKKALYGLKQDGESGFLKQLDELFSPQGYYSEGPYYQRFALMPFVIFSKAIQENDPARKIYEHRNGVLLKAIYTVVQLSYDNYFFPINDAIKDKGLDTAELAFALSIAYGLNGDDSLLSIAKLQDDVTLSGDGFKLAQALDAGSAKPFPYASMNLGDGADGQQGALGILRSGSKVDDETLVFKATGQGMGHGHFDKLSWIFYDNGNEIVSDYGAARFLNVVEKNGGAYLPENKSWAKQTVAHNTLVVDEKSHFNAKLDSAMDAHPEILVFVSNDEIELVSARMQGAYSDVDFTRTFALIKSDVFSKPIVLDVMNVMSDSAHQYDLPLHYKGQITSISQGIQASTSTMQALGKDNGYQHLWQRARADLSDGNFQITWLTENRFYSYTTITDRSMQALFTQTGANDPVFNLRHETGLILRANNAKKHTFVATLEPHGEYNGTKEFTNQSASLIKSLERFSENGNDLIIMTTKQDQVILVALSYDNDLGKEHSINFDDQTIEWTGFYKLIEKEIKQGISDDSSE